MPDNNEDIVYIIDGSGNDGTFQQGDDLEEEVVETLSKYLHNLSKDGKNGNKFQISPNLEMSSVQSPDGNGSVLDLNVKGSSNPYAPTSQNPSLSRYSDSGQIFVPTIGDYLKKGKADTFLLDINGKTDKSGASTTISPDNPIIKAIDNALDNNRFSPGVRGPFINENNIDYIDPTIGDINDRTTQEISVVGRTQNRFGVYNREGFDLKMSELKKIGHSLMLRSAREIKAVQEGDPTSFTVAAGALIPGATQIGILKVDTNNIRASRVMEENFGLPKPRTDTESIVNPGTQSWGHLNTPLEPYDGFLPIGMTGLGIALAVSFRLVITGFLGLLGVMIKEKNFNVPHRGPFIAGEYGKPSPGSRLLSLRAIGIKQTEHDFLSCVSEGLDVFFEVSGGDFRRILREPQTFVNLIRTILRSGNIIINSVRDVFSSGQNPLAAAQAFLGLADVLKSSDIIAFFNIMAQLGDVSLTKQEKGFGQDAKKVSDTENLPINPATNVMRIRNKRSILKSGMSQDASLSKFIFPISLLQAGELVRNVGMKKAIAALPKNHIANNDEVFEDTQRLKPDVVAKIEAELDSEYVPFYFHDLRTNEIISFHAFLNSLDDRYSPEYESVQAYGRVDKIRTYISTEREISLSFNIVATNHESFDLMWWKINKLTTLLYPSWTEGRSIAVGPTKFIQPFSQLPASTPLIRLRIGDIVRSNYSRFNLQRLFGLGSGKEKFNLIPTPEVPGSLLEQQKKLISDIRERMMRNPALGSINDGYEIGELAILLPNRKGYDSLADQIKAGARALSLVTGKPNLKKRLVLTSATRVIIIQNPKTVSTIPLIDSEYGEHQLSRYIVRVFSTSIPDEMSGDYICTYDDLVPDQIGILQKAGAIDPAAFASLTSSEPIAAAPGFGAQDPTPTNPFSTNNNVIVRSFESVQGKGLGGVITNLTYGDLASQNNIWETSEYGSRGPKIVKVDLSFAVIHDIAPGIDYKGFNRAPVYPIGKIGQALGGDSYDETRQGETLFNKYHQKASVGLKNGNNKG